MKDGSNFIDNQRYLIQLIIDAIWFYNYTLQDMCVMFSLFLCNIVVTYSTYCVKHAWLCSGSIVWFVWQCIWAALEFELIDFNGVPWLCKWLSCMMVILNILQQLKKGIVVHLQLTCFDFIIVCHIYNIKKIVLLFDIALRAYQSHDPCLPSTFNLPFENREKIM